MEHNLSNEALPPEKFRPVGLAFTVSSLAPPRQNHVGLILFDAEEWKLIHQTGGRPSYSVEPAPRQFYVWVDVSHKVDQLERGNLAGLCSLMVKRESQNRLPFGYSDYKGWIDSTGEIRDANGRSGLTCSGFVLAMLNTCNIEWLKTDTWPDPPPQEDTEWQRSTAPRAARGNATQLATMLLEVGKKRYKPEQVGGAGLVAEMPCCLLAANDAGAFVVSQALALRQPPPQPPPVAATA